MSSSGSETEIKLRLRDAQEGLTRLAKLGYALRRARYFESNVLYDREGDELRGKGDVLRVRDAAGAAVLTFKERGTPGRHKVREELEVTTSCAKTTSAILERLGYAERFRYEKYRTEFHRPEEAGLILLDETPAGCFLELEGEPSWIDRTAAELGFSEMDYVLESYVALHAEVCRSQGKPLGNMLFLSAE